MVLDSLLMILVAYTMGFLFYGVYRQLSARVQRRFGPTIWQNFFDNMKLLFKSESLTHGPMFFFGPIIMTAGAVTTLLFVPFLKDSDSLQGFSEYGNLILVVYLMVVGPLGNALAVGVSGNPFGVMGVTRGLTRLMGLEVPFFLGLAMIMLDSGSVSILEIANAQNSVSEWNIFQNPIAFIVIFLPFIAAMGASPFDVVGAPVEVYSGPRAEFGGRFLGLLLTQNMIFSIAKLILIVNLFLGGASSVFELIIKAFALFMASALVSMVFPRLKTEQAVDFFWKVPLGIGIIGVIATIWMV